MANVKEISVFVDESGSFEADEESSRFYIVCFVLHDQDADLSPWIENLESFFTNVRLGRQHCVHVGPLIRREGEYRTMLREHRQSIFRRMMAFVRKSDITYRCFAIDKHFNTGDKAVHDVLLRDILRFLIDHSADLASYQRIKVYYDNGQSQVKHLLEEAFSAFSATTVFVQDVTPEKYRLFQAADLCCSIELAAAKLAVGQLSQSELRFFGSEREFKRNILKPLRIKSL